MLIDVSCVKCTLMVSTADDAVNNQVDKVIPSVVISQSLSLGFLALAQ